MPKKNDLKTEVYIKIEICEKDGDFHDVAEIFTPGDFLISNGFTVIELTDMLKRLDQMKRILVDHHTGNKMQNVKNPRVFKIVK